jgi:hypothetical protein
LFLSYGAPGPVPGVHRANTLPGTGIYLVAKVEVGVDGKGGGGGVEGVLERERRVFLSAHTYCRGDRRQMTEDDRRQKTGELVRWLIVDIVLQKQS